jgi:hypothetical protein
MVVTLSAVDGRYWQVVTPFDCAQGDNFLQLYFIKNHSSQTFNHSKNFFFKYLVDMSTQFTFALS